MSAALLFFVENPQSARPDTRESDRVPSFFVVVRLARWYSLPPPSLWATDLSPLVPAVLYLFFPFTNNSAFGHRSKSIFLDRPFRVLLFHYFSTIPLFYLLFSDFCCLLPQTVFCGTCAALCRGLTCSCKSEPRTVSLSDFLPCLCLTSSCFFFR